MAFGPGRSGRDLQTDAGLVERPLVAEGRGAPRAPRLRAARAAPSRPGRRPGRARRGRARPRSGRSAGTRAPLRGAVSPRASARVSRGATHPWCQRAEREHRREHGDLRREPPAVRRVDQLAPRREVEPARGRGRSPPGSPPPARRSARRRESRGRVARVAADRRRRRPARQNTVAKAEQPAHPRRHREEVECLRSEGQPAALDDRRAVAHQPADHHDEAARAARSHHRARGGRRPALAIRAAAPITRSSTRSPLRRATRGRAACRGASPARRPAGARPASARAWSARSSVPPTATAIPPRASMPPIHRAPRDREMGRRRGRPGAALRPSRPAIARAASIPLRSGPWAGFPRRPPGRDRADREDVGAAGDVPVVRRQHAPGHGVRAVRQGRQPDAVAPRIGGIDGGPAQVDPLAARVQHLERARARLDPLGEPDHHLARRRVQARVRRGIHRRRDGMRPRGRRRQGRSEEDGRGHQAPPDGGPAAERASAGRRRRATLGTTAGGRRTSCRNRMDHSPRETRTWSVETAARAHESWERGATSEEERA